MPERVRGASLDVMDDPDIDRPRARGHPVYLVEAYRPPDAEAAMHRVVGDGGTVVAVIDIPTDETVLFLVVTPDAPAAERVIRDRGVIPIRVVDVHWDPPG